MRWRLIEGLLSDGLPMRMWIAEQNGKIRHSALHDDAYRCAEEEFLWRCGYRGPDDQGGGEVLRRAARQLREYFAGKRLDFDIPLDFHGTPFQIRVWRELTRIRFGSVKSYGEIAEAIGLPKAPRAVGGANGRNHLPIFVPCHRVIASGGKLGGFTGGIGLKKRLLAHEAAVLARRKAAA